jgi:hypothetical protein
MKHDTKSTPKFGLYLGGIIPIMLCLSALSALASGPLGEWKNVAGPTFTRPADATPYTSGDLVANSVTAGSVVPIAIVFGSAGTTENQIELSRIRLFKSTTGVTGATFRVHLFSTLPTVSAGDNAAIVIATGAVGYLGFFDIAAMQSFTDGANGAITTGSNRIVLSGSTTIYALIEARGAYTPGTSETFTLTLEGTVNR